MNSRRWLVVFGLVPGIGCGGSGSGSGSGGAGGVYESVPEGSAPSVFAREYCRLLLQECDCPTPQQIFSSPSQCENAMAMQLEADFDEAQAAGLQYDPECMGQYVTLFTQGLACHTPSEVTADVLSLMNAPTCKVHAGTGAAGEACESYYTAFGDTCAQGLMCFGTCMPIRIPKLAGEACDFQTDVCESGTACSATPDNPTAASCVPLPGEGELCTAGCETGLVCQFDPETNEGRCSGPPPIGSECASPPYECEAGGYCEGSQCVAALPLGSPCIDDRECGVGQICDEPEDGAQDECMPERPLVCF